MEPGPAVYLAHSRAELWEVRGVMGWGWGSWSDLQLCSLGLYLVTNPFLWMTNWETCMSGFCRAFFWYTWKEACSTSWNRLQSSAGRQAGRQAGRRALIILHHRKLKQTIKSLHPVHETTPCSDQKRLYVWVFQCVCKENTGIKQFKRRNVLQSLHGICALIRLAHIKCGLSYVRILRLF